LMGFFSVKIVLIMELSSTFTVRDRRACGEHCMISRKKN
jgi:hypothetical protein